LASIEENIRHLLTGCVRGDTAIGFLEACMETIKNKFFPGGEKRNYVILWQKIYQ
jgi:hypothetical protein